MTLQETVHALQRLLSSVEENISHCLMLNTHFVDDIEIHVRDIRRTSLKNIHISIPDTHLAEAMITFVTHDSKNKRTAYDAYLTSVKEMLETNTHLLKMQHGADISLQVAKFQRVGTYVSEIV